MQLLSLMLIGFVGCLRRVRPIDRATTPCGYPPAGPLLALLEGLGLFRPSRVGCPCRVGRFRQRSEQSRPRNNRRSAWPPRRLRSVGTRGAPIRPCAPPRSGSISARPRGPPPREAPRTAAAGVRNLRPAPEFRRSRTLDGAITGRCSRIPRATPFGARSGWRARAHHGQYASPATTSFSSVSAAQTRFDGYPGHKRPAQSCRSARACRVASATERTAFDVRSVVEPVFEAGAPAILGVVVLVEVATAAPVGS
jgi:hypothetical protein